MDRDADTASFTGGSGLTRVQSNPTAESAQGGGERGRTSPCLVVLSGDLPAELSNVADAGLLPIGAGATGLLIGRADDAALRFDDAEVAWNHAEVAHEHGRVTLANLAASGTRINGKPAVGAVRLRHGDTIELTERCTLQFEDAAGGGEGGWSSKLIGPAVVAVVLVTAVAIAFAWANARSSGDRRALHWPHAVQHLEAWLDAREPLGAASEPARVLIGRALRVEQLGNLAVAAGLYADLLQLLREQPGFDVTAIRDSAGLGTGRPRTDTALMKLLKPTPGGVDALSDEEYAEALALLAMVKLDLLRSQLDEDD
ncbi:MAG: FHA domain-containing protein [Planctomycetota bacterium]